MQHWITRDSLACGPIAGLTRPQDVIFMSLEGFGSEDGKQFNSDMFASDGLTAAVTVVSPETAEELWRSLVIALRTKSFAETAKEQGCESLVARWSLADGREVVMAADNNFGNQLSDKALEKFGELDIPATDWLVRESLSPEAGALPTWLESLAPERAPALRR